MMTTYLIRRNHRTIIETTNWQSAITMARHWDRINPSGCYHVVAVTGAQQRIIWTYAKG